MLKVSSKDKLLYRDPVKRAALKMGDDYNKRSSLFVAICCHRKFSTSQESLGYPEKNG